MRKTKTKYPFKKGWLQVPNGETKKVRDELMSALGITEIHGWYRRLNGSPVPRIDEKEKIDAIFAKYGITDVWDKIE